MFPLWISFNCRSIVSNIHLKSKIFFLISCARNLFPASTHISFMLSKPDLTPPSLLALFEYNRRSSMLHVLSIQFSEFNCLTHCHLFIYSFIQSQMFTFTCIWRTHCLVCSLVCLCLTLIRRRIRVNRSVALT